ncbi:hypothetical protein MKEN_01363000 [Mycena kentingensis (nom. inval.)]|nr:hypothetical protein MKEN_01363000 [Mycena kentingensis (nom. inval.)]
MTGGRGRSSLPAETSRDCKTPTREIRVYSRTAALPTSSFPRCTTSTTLSACLYVGTRTAGSPQELEHNPSPPPTLSFKAFVRSPVVDRRLALKQTRLSSYLIISLLNPLAGPHSLFPSYMFIRLFTVAVAASVARGHLAPFHKAMYGLNGVDGGVNQNSDAVVQPLYQLTKADWWFHHYNRVDEFPPKEGDYLELPAGGSFTVEIASNRGKTSLSFAGKYTSDWPDGGKHPDDYNEPGCIASPNMHTQNYSRAAGTAFAISYTSDIKKVTADNLAVFTVRYHTPWKRLTSYDVPADMPACPDGGCICAWGWVPNGCGQPNMYHLPYRCKVTGATATKAIGTPKPPVWCENDSGSCTKGPKQMIYWNQKDGNNIEVDGFDAAGDHKSPAYNSKCGFSDGAQNDIFTGASTTSKVATPSSNDDHNDDEKKTTTTAEKATETDSTTSTSSTASSASPSEPSKAASPTCKTKRSRSRRAAKEARAEGVMVHRRRHMHGRSF